MQYGFLIDHTRCIGCHACTVACKSENDVPVGDFRTWVKYTEKGVFPDIRRHFAVLRCNHCTKAPCVTICPVNALVKRDDGIVDIDRDACIGCRACMQACPYDAIYLNEDHGAVEKCHFCAHRVEKGLEPACAVVCPENAIIAGDLHDPKSTISQLIRANDTLVRRPEQKTGPNVHYVGVLREALEPGVASKEEMFLWSDRPKRKPEQWPVSLPVVPETRTVLDTEHSIQWGWGVAAYLVTKGIAAGVAMLAPFLSMYSAHGFATDYLPEILALVFIAITGVLLVEDLYKPMAFIRLFTRPNWKSWLVKGAWVINIFVAVVGASLVLRLFEMDAAADSLRWLGALAGIAVAGYTAFLFAQCEGRDLWQGGPLLAHLIVQALMLGAIVLGACMSEEEALRACVAAFSGTALLHLVISLFERYAPHATTNSRQAAAFLTVVRFGPFCAFRDGLIMVGAGFVVALFWPFGIGFVLAAIVPVIAGLFLYEYAFIRAGQLPPLS
jgi:Fe-S-cluster-containing dehydrogenase component/formate-dependent nitrite reductase membrane component NrfD